MAPTSVDFFDNDQLNIHAMGKISDVPLREGTPAVFVYTDSRTGEQDWNEVQAFVGAANDNSKMNLYAEDNMNLGAILGDILVSKRVDNAAPSDNEREFTFAVMCSTDPYFSSTPEWLDFNAHPVQGASSVQNSSSANPHTFKLKNGGVAIIRSLPVDGYYYKIVEIGPFGSPGDMYDIPDFTVTDAKTPINKKPGTSVSIGGSDGYATDAFQIDPNNQKNVFITVTNSRNYPQAHLRISKQVVAYDENGDRLDPDTRFTFKLEFKEVNKNWQPVNLTGRITIDSGHGGVVGSASNGTFWLKNRGLAYIEMDPDPNHSRIYRVVEVKPNPPPRYGTYYAIFKWNEVNGDYVAEELVSTNPINNQNYMYDFDKNQTVDTGDFIMDDDTFYDVVFVNAPMYDIEISKRVTGNIIPDDLDRLFEFQVRYYELGAWKPFRLTADSADTDKKLFIEIRDNSGNAVDAGTRLFEDADGDTTIFKLKHNETATVKSVPSYYYSVYEKVGGRFVATYTVNTGKGVQNGNGGNAEFILPGDSNAETVKVDFVNRVPDKEPHEPEDPEDPNTPDTPDKPNKPNTPDSPGNPNKPRTPGDSPNEPDTPDEPNDHDNRRHSDSNDTTVSSNETANLDDGTPAAPGSGGSGDTQKRSPQTGDARGIMSVFTLIIGAGIITFAALKRRKANK